MATIKDVARDAGVSVGTVSNVINGAKVGDEKRALVENSIKKLDYRVSGWARGLKTQRTDCVLIILPSLENPFFTMLLSALEKKLYACKKQIFLCISDGDKEKEAKFIELAVENKIDGIIGITYSNIEEYLTEPIVFVSLDRHLQAFFPIPVVASDNRLGGRTAAEVLHRGGCHKLLCLLTISSRNTEVRKRKTGFEEYCQENDIFYNSIEISENQIKSIYSSFESRKLIHDILLAYMNSDFGDGCIDGIFASTDHLGIVICEELRKMGKRVPEDVQVIGFDGLKLINQGDVLISSIEQPVELLAETAVDSLLKLLNHEEVPDVTNLPIRFVDGGTTKTRYSDV